MPRIFTWTPALVLALYEKYLENDEFAAAEMNARGARDGLWIELGPVVPWDHRSRG